MLSGSAACWSARKHKWGRVVFGGVARGMQEEQEKGGRNTSVPRSPSCSSPSLNYHISDRHVLFGGWGGGGTGKSTRTQMWLDPAPCSLKDQRSSFHHTNQCSNFIYVTEQVGKWACKPQYRWKTGEQEPPTLKSLTTACINHPDYQNHYCLYSCI